MKTVCLLCRRSRIETACGDQSCPCTGGVSQNGVQRVTIPGLGYNGPKGVRLVVAECGKLVPEKNRRNP